jgi:TRAP-type mannitol/chloroaromatic compound transport system permease small subunit
MVFASDMRRLADFLDSINERIGRAIAWLLLALVLCQFAVVVLRYVFGAGSLWLQEGVIYLHATIFMSAAGYTLLHDGHVRVSVFYDRASTRLRAAIDLLGSLVLLMPFCIVLFAESLPYVGRSWSLLEGSADASGLPTLFLLKTLIPVLAILLGLAGLSSALRTAYALHDRADR